MKKQNVLPAIVLFGLVAVVAALLTLPGAESLLNDIGAIGNLLLAILILLVFIVGPWLVGGYASMLVNTMLEKTRSNWYWHWAFLLATSALLLVGWPYLVQAVVPTTDWNWTRAESISRYMVSKTPLVGWGIYASVAGAVVYWFFIDHYRLYHHR